MLSRVRRGRTAINASEICCRRTDFICDEGTLCQPNQGALAGICVWLVRAGRLLNDNERRYLLRDIINSSEAAANEVVMYIEEKEVVKQNVVNFWLGE